MTPRKEVTCVGSGLSIGIDPSPYEGQMSHHGGEVCVGVRCGVFWENFFLVRYLKAQLGAVCKPPGTDSAPLLLVPTAYMKNDLCISSFSTTFLLPTYLLYASFHNYLLWGVAHQFPQPQ